MPRLNGKRALVTGATSGIGLETARLFLEEGARVAITGRDAARLAAAKAELGGDVVGILADSGSVADQASTAEAIRKAFGGLDVLFANAGQSLYQPLETWDEASFDGLMAVNLKGPFFLVQQLLPLFANPSSIVLNTSTNAHIAMIGSNVYGATKAGLISLARALSVELIGRGIRVNAVSPGPTATPVYEKYQVSEEAIRQLEAQVPLGRRGTPREIAYAVLYLASDESLFTVGSEFLIDGGITSW